MGNMQQQGYADAVGDGIPLEAALHASFASNFYPPLPGALVAPTVVAINAVNDGAYDTIVTLPADLHVIPKCATRNDDGTWNVAAADLVEVTRTWPFTNDQD